MSLFDAIGTGLQVGVGDANLSFETRPETWPDPIRSGFSYVFERPDELVDGFEDTQDLPLGEVSDPLNLGGEDADKNLALKAAIVAVLVGAVLWLVRPLLELSAEVAS